MSSGDEDDFDPSTYAQKRDEFLRKIIISENHFKKIRSLQLKLKKADLKKQRNQLANGTHPKLIEGIKKIDEEAKQALALVHASYELQKNAMERVSEANRSSIRNQLNEDIASLRDKMRDHIKAQIKKKEMFRTNYEKTMWALHRLHNKIEKEANQEKHEVVVLDEDENSPEDEVNVGASSSRQVENSEKPDEEVPEPSPPKSKKNKKKEPRLIFPRDYCSRNLYF